MSFDKTNVSDLQKLADEVYGNPAVYTNPEDTDDVLNRLNDPALNQGGETAPEMFTVALVWKTLEPAELNTAKYAGEEFKLEYIEAMIGGNIPGSVNVDDLRDRYLSCLPNPSQSRTNFDACVEPISRAEVDILFGRYTVISRDDWLAAKRYHAATAKGGR